MNSDIRVFNMDKPFEVVTSIVVSTVGSKRAYLEDDGAIVSLGSPDIMYENKHKNNGFKTYETDKFNVVCLGKTMLYYAKENAKVMQGISCINRQAYYT